MNPPNEQFAKEVIFQVYAAGFEDGYSGEDDLATSFEKWWGEQTSCVGASVRRRYSYDEVV